MRVDRPAPGEELNPGAPTEPRQAATVIVLRGGSGALEVLMVRRNPAARFMGGAWVFPGGAVDAADATAADAAAEVAAPARRDATAADATAADATAAHRAAGVREVAEEAGLRLPGPDALVPFSRWITPPQLRIRFDTHFFLASAPRGQRARPDGGEVVDARWYAPAGALEAHAAGAIDLVFPTIKHLEALAAFATADAVLAWAGGHEVTPVVPVVVHEGEVARIVLPGDPRHPG